MPRIMLPLVHTTNVVDAIAAADVQVAVIVVVHVDVDIVIAPTATPTPTATPRSSQCDTNSKRDRRRGNHGSSRIRWIVNRGVRIDRGTVNIDRIVDGYVDHLRTCLFYYYDCLLLHDLSLNS